MPSKDPKDTLPFAYEYIRHRRKRELKRVRIWVSIMAIPLLFAVAAFWFMPSKEHQKQALNNEVAEMVDDDLLKQQRSSRADEFGFESPEAKSYEAAPAPEVSSLPEEKPEKPAEPRFVEPTPAKEAPAAQPNRQIRFQARTPQPRTPQPRTTSSHFTSTQHTSSRQDHLSPKLQTLAVLVSGDRRSLPVQTAVDHAKPSASSRNLRPTRPAPAPTRPANVPEPSQSKPTTFEELASAASKASVPTDSEPAHEEQPALSTAAIIRAEFRNAAGVTKVYEMRPLEKINAQRFEAPQIETPEAALPMTTLKVKVISSLNEEEIKNLMQLNRLEEIQTEELKLELNASYLRRRVQNISAKLN